MLALPPLDARAVRLQFERRAARFDGADFLLREIERQALKRLDYVRLAPNDLLDVGCGLGHGAAALAARYPQVTVTAVDASPAMAARAAERIGRRPGALAQIARLLGAATRSGSPHAAHALAAEAQALPFADASFDLLWSNCALHWFADPIATLAEWRRVLRPQALLTFTAFGVDTLRELRALGTRTMGFPDMHDLGDALVAAGFAEPVMDMHLLTLTYASPERLLEDLRALGGNALAGRAPGLTGRGRLDRARAALRAARDADPQKQLSLSFEVVHGHAWVPKPSRLPAGYAPVDFVRKPAGKR